MRFPRLKTFLSVFPLDETTWGVRGGTDELWRIKLTDQRAIHAFAALLPYLNGRTDIDEILRALDRAGIHRGAAAAVLRQLEASSFLEEMDAGGLSDSELHEYQEQIRFLSRFGQNGGARLQAALRRSRIGLIADGRLGASVYARIADAGFGEVVVLARQPSRAAEWVERTAVPRPATRVLALDADRIWPADSELPQLLIVCEDTHDPELLEAIDLVSKQRRLPWLLVRHLDLQEGWVGPLFVPGETASYLSLEARLRASMSRLSEYEAFDAHVRTTGRPPAFGGLHAGFDLLASIAVIEAIKFVTEIKMPELFGKFLTINFWTWETELHEVLRVPALDRRDAPRPAVFPWKVLSHADGAQSSAGA
jgi:bacteriocin biosynthesis cyclodehydratase domain-containing protein